MVNALDFQIQMTLGKFERVMFRFEKQGNSKNQNRFCPRSRMISTISLNENPMNNPRVPPTDPTNPVIS